MAQQQQQKKLKKSYSALIEEIRSVMSKTAAVYIPELCTALAVEDPHLSNKEIKDRIYLDLNGIWEESTIEKSFPSWIHNPGKVATAKKAWETKNAKKSSSVEKIITELNKVDLPEPRLPEIRYEHEELDFEGGRLATYGEKGKTISQLKGNITYHTARLFEALTESDHLPFDSEDLTVDYIKPTRQFRKSLVLELDEQGRKTVWNALGAVEAAIQDTLDILEDEMKKS
jgi:hypothetical protein